MRKIEISEGAYIEIMKLAQINAVINILQSGIFASGNSHSGLSIILNEADKIRGELKENIEIT